MNNLDQLIGESIWSLYSDMAYILHEKSALPRIETDDGEEEVAGNGYWSGDPDDVRSIKRIRKEFAVHLKGIRKGTKEPAPRPGPRSQGGTASRTHAQAAADIKSDIMGSRGEEHEENVKDVERAVSAREKQAVGSRQRSIKKPKPR